MFQRRPGILKFPLKKVLVAKGVWPLIEKERSFLDRAGIRIYTAATNDEALALHREQKADLIIAMLDGAGTNGEELCSTIRDDDELRRVSIIILCSDTEGDRKRCLRCRANAFITAPISTAILLQEAHQLLNIAPREAFRAPIDVNLNVSSREASFASRSENISASGMLLATEAVIPEGDTITCSFDLPGLGYITANAIVARACERDDEGDINRYGIAFVEPSRDVTYAIKIFIGKQSRNSKG
jgi:CheY-like chemotaxis protein